MWCFALSLRQSDYFSLNTYLFNLPEFSFYFGEGAESPLLLSLLSSSLFMSSSSGLSFTVVVCVLFVFCFEMVTLCGPGCPGT